MIDLHLHLDGSLSPEEILQLAACSGVTLPCKDADSLRPLLEAEPDCQNLGEYLEKFDLPLQVLQTEAALSLSVRCLLKRLAAQGLCYAEIRFAPQLHVACGLTQQQVVTAAVSGLQCGIREFGMPAQLILCCMRGSDNLQANLETVRTAKSFLGHGVCAVDLAGNEAAYPTKDFAHIFQTAQDLNIPIIIHAGEAAGPESIQQALMLGAKRIGHGIRAAEDTACVSQLCVTQIPLELCFTSNCQTKAVNDPNSYPLQYFLEQGIRLTVNTDNMTVSGTTLRREYLRLHRELGIPTDTLQTIACNAADAAFVTPQEADRLKSRICKDFSRWLENGTIA